MARLEKPAADAPKSDAPPEVTEETAKTAHVSIADVTDTSPENVAKLLAQVRELQEQLGARDITISDMQAQALERAKAQGMLMQREIEEVDAQETIEVDRIDHYKTVGYHDDGREIRRPKFKKVTLPLYFYKIDLPPCGGSDMKINGFPLYHGSVVKVDIDTLRTIKDMVYRCWKHDLEIHGSDENVYRKPQMATISARGMGR
jgi:hypothetical protein